MESVPLNLSEVVCDGGCILYLRWCVQSHGAMNECKECKLVRCPRVYPPTQWNSDYSYNNTWRDVLSWHHMKGYFILASHEYLWLIIDFQFAIAPDTSSKL